MVMISASRAFYPRKVKELHRALAPAWVLTFLQYLISLRPPFMQCQPMRGWSIILTAAG